jgi:hypothetical protein
LHPNLGKGMSPCFQYGFVFTPLRNLFKISGPANFHGIIKLKEEMAVIAEKESIAGVGSIAGGMRTKVRRNAKT